MSAIVVPLGATYLTMLVTVVTPRNPSCVGSLPSLAMHIVVPFGIVRANHQEGDFWSDPSSSNDLSPGLNVNVDVNNRVLLSTSKTYLPKPIVYVVVGISWTPLTSNLRGDLSCQLLGVLK